MERNGRWELRGRKQRVVCLEAAEEEEAPSVDFEFDLLGYPADEVGAWSSRVPIDELPLLVIDRDQGRIRGAFHRKVFRNDGENADSGSFR